MVIFSLMGCINNQNDEAMNNGDNTENVGYDDQKAVNHSDYDDADQKRLEVAAEAADRIATLDKLDNANVIGTNQTAYMAVVMRDAKNEEGTKKIAGQVKTTYADIQKVFVSADLDFADRMTDYGEGINEGPPAEDLFKEELKDAVQRVFSDAPLIILMF